MDPHRRRMRTIELAHAALAALTVGIAGWVAPKHVVYGLAAGFVLGALNARALAALAGRVTGGDSAQRGGAAALLLLKMLLLMAAVAAVLQLLAPNPLAFIAAISAAPAMLIVVGLLAGAPRDDALEAGR